MTKNLLKSGKSKSLSAPNLKDQFRSFKSQLIAGVAALGLFAGTSSIPVLAQPGYQPTASNLANRATFAQDRYGLFIHWGIYSPLADGEWVMKHRLIGDPQYQKLASQFNPTQFNADAWVKMAKDAGMKYITITSKHHDGFCLWDSKVTKYDVVDATPYGKDIIKQLADACAKHGVKLGLYYSLLDWHHPDYYMRGDHGPLKFMGAKKDGDFSKYVDYMCAQLTELLTNYGPINCIWFDGEWESLEANWNFPKIYETIHKAQPGCLIGNNHHRNVRPGEDFQMFEKDLPGANSHGWVDQAASVANNLPLEMCETMNGSWGYNVKDTRFKSSKYLVQLLAKSAASNANLLLNVSPMGNGVIQQEFQDTLASMSKWLKVHGTAIYGTQGGMTRSWGGTTLTKDKVYVHLHKPEDKTIWVPMPPNFKPGKANVMHSGAIATFKVGKDGIWLDVPTNLDGRGTVVEVSK